MREQLIATQDYFGITGRKLADAAEISPQHWSEYRRGKCDISTGKAWAVLEAMEAIAPGAKQYFCQSILGKSEIETQLEQLVDLADEGQLERIMLRIVRRIFPKSRNLTDEVSPSNSIQSPIYR